MTTTKFPIIILLIGLLVAGCSANTPEGSCQSACLSSYNCFEYKKFDDRTKCKQECFNKCYKNVLGNDTQ